MSIDMEWLQRLALSALPVLLDAAIKGVLFLAVAGTLVLGMRKASAATKQAVWLLAMAALLVLPLASVALPSWQVLPGWVKIEIAADKAEPVSAAAPIDSTEALLSGGPSRGTDLPGTPAVHAMDPVPQDYATESGSPPVPAVAMDPGQHASPSPATSASTVKPASIAEPWWTWAVPLGIAAWLAGTLVCLLPLVLGRVSLWKLARRSQRIGSGSWSTLSERAAKVIALRRPITLLQSSDEPMPMVWGLFQPRLLLPAEAENWPLERRWVVLLHELAHAKRHDCLAKAIAHVACAFYWFNPLAWVAFKLMQREAEAACDDLVLNSQAHPAVSSMGVPPVRPSEYAQHLLEIASGLDSGMLAAYSSIAMARKSKLEGRLLAILDDQRSRRRLTRWGLAVVALAVAVVAIVLGVMHVETERDLRFHEQTPPIFGSKEAEKVWREIKLVGVCPDSGDELLDPEGKSIDKEWPYVMNDREWGDKKLARDLVFALPQDPGLLWLSIPDVRVSGTERQLGVGYGNVKADGKQQVVSLFLDKTYVESRFWYNYYLPIDRIDVTLKYYLPGQGHSVMTFVGPFETGKPVNNKEGLSCTLTAIKKDYQGNAQFHVSGAHIPLKSLTGGEERQFLAYDIDGRRHLVQSRTGGAGGSAGDYHIDYDFVVEGLSPERLAMVTFGEEPESKTFCNVLVSYPNRPARQYPEYLDRVAERLGLVGLSPDQIRQYEVRNADEAFAVLDIARGRLLDRAWQKIQLLDFAALSKEQQEIIRRTARKWVNCDIPFGFELGLKAQMPELVAPALQLLREHVGPDPNGRYMLAASALLAYRAYTPQELNEIAAVAAILDDPRQTGPLVQCLDNHRNDPGGSEALLQLARTDKVWLWWPAVSALTRGEGMTYAQLPADVRVKCLAMTGPDRGLDSNLAQQARALLARSLTAKTAFMWYRSDVARAVANYLDRADAQRAYVGFLQDMADHWDQFRPGDGNEHVRMTVKGLNYWNGLNLGNLGADPESYETPSSNVDYQALAKQTVAHFHKSANSQPATSVARPAPQISPPGWKEARAPEGGKVFGYTLTDALGKAIPNATLQLRPAGAYQGPVLKDRQPIRVTSDDKGKFRLTWPADTYRLSGSVSQPMYGIAPVELFPNSSSFDRVDLVPKGSPQYERALKGQVMDEDGRPVGGALVVGETGDLQQPSGWHGKAITDGDGRFTLYAAPYDSRNNRQLPADARYHVTIYAADRDLWPVAADVRTPAGIVMPKPKLKARSMRFEVGPDQYAEGNQRTCIIRMQWLAPGSQQATDLDNRYVYEKAGLMPGRYLAQYHDGRSRTFSYEPVDVDANSPDVITFHRKPAVTYVGKVVDGVSGKPIAGAFVTYAQMPNLAMLSETDWQKIQALPRRPTLGEDGAKLLLQQWNATPDVLTRTDDQGNFEILCDGEHEAQTITAFAKDRLPVRIGTGSLKPDKQRVPLPEIPLYQAAYVKVLPMMPAGTRPSVNASWEFLPDGQPKWFDSLRQFDDGNYRRIQSNEWLDMKGPLRVFVPANVRLKVKFNCPNAGDIAVQQIDRVFDLKPGETADAGELRIDQPATGPASQPAATGVTIVGTVLDEPGGKGAKSVEVTLWKAQQLIDKTVTASDGTYRFTAVPYAGMEYAVRVGKHGPGVWTEDALVFVEKTQASSEIHAIDLHLKLPSLGGTVTDVDTGKPVSGAEINFSTINNGEAILTDENGRFLLYVLPRKVNLYCNGTSGRYYPVTPGKEVSVKAGQNVAGVDFAIRSAKPFSGQVLLPDGKPAANFPVLAMVDWSRGWAEDSKRLDEARKRRQARIRNGAEKAPYETTENRGGGLSGRLDDRGIGCSFFLKTDAQGRFQGYLRRPETGLHYDEAIAIVLIARSDDKTLGAFKAIQTTTIDPPPEPASVTLSKTATAEFEIYDTNGLPVSNAKPWARLWLFGFINIGRDIPQVAPDFVNLGHGRYRATGLVPQFDYRLRAEAEGYRCDTERKVVANPGEKVDAGRLVLDKVGVKQPTTGPAAASVDFKPASDDANVFECLITPQSAKPVLLKLSKFRFDADGKVVSGPSTVGAGSRDFPVTLSGTVKAENGQVSMHTRVAKAEGDEPLVVSDSSVIGIATGTPHIVINRDMDRLTEDGCVLWLVRYVENGKTAGTVACIAFVVHDEGQVKEFLAEQPAQVQKTVAAFNAAPIRVPSAISGPATQATVNDDESFLKDAASKLTKAVGGQWKLSDKPRDRGPTLYADFTDFSKQNPEQLVYGVWPHPWSDEGRKTWNSGSAAVAYFAIASNEHCTLLVTWHEDKAISAKIINALGLRRLQPKSQPATQPASVSTQPVFTQAIHGNPRVLRTGDLVVLAQDATDDDLALLGDGKGIVSLHYGGGVLGGPVARITDKGMAHLANWKDLRELIWWPFTMDNVGREVPHITDAGLKHLAGMKNLQKLDLSGQKITDDGLSHLSGLTNLEELRLDGVPLTGECLTHFRGLTKLKVLRLYGAAITDADILNLSKMTQMEDLQLGRSRITDKGMETIGRMKKLKTLDLQYSLISDKGLEQIAGLTELTWLCLKSTDVSNEGLKQLQALNKLEWLILDDTKITGEGLRSVRGLKSLRVLYLNRTDIDDEGIGALVALPKLERLKLNGTKLTDAGLMKLAQAKTLKELEVEQALTTAEGRAKFKQAAPHVSLKVDQAPQPATPVTQPQQ